MPDVQRAAGGQRGSVDGVDVAAALGPVKLVLHAPRPPARPLVLKAVKRGCRASGLMRPSISRRPRFVLACRLPRGARTALLGWRYADASTRQHRSQGQPAVPGRDDVRRAGATPTTTSRSGSSTARWTRASTSSTPPTCTRPGSPRRSSARRWPGRARSRRAGHQGPRRHGRRPERAAATPAAGSSASARTACAAWAPTTSTCTRSTGPIRDADIDETLGALTDLIRAGKILYAGSSTFPPSQIVEAQWAAQRRGRERFVCEQPPYSILVRGIEAEVLPVCQQYGMGVIPWSPLAGGWLSGRYRQGRRGAGRAAAPSACRTRYDLSLPGNQAKLEAAEQLAVLADEAGPVPDPPGPGLRAQPPGGHRRDHRAADHGASGQPARRRRHRPRAGDPGPDRRDRAAGPDP